MYLHQKILRVLLAVGAIIWAFFFILVAAEDSHADERLTWKAHATAMETKYSLPPNLLKAVCTQESNWRNVVGAAGEIGICQVQVNTVYMICPSCRNGGSKSFTLDSAGNAVQHIQRALAIQGLYRGKIDGIFGPQTRAATVAYQHANALQVDGIVGPRTWAVLVKEPYPGTSVASVLWTPHGNIEWAARYLAWLRDNVSPEPTIMMAAYNGGPANPIVKYMLSVNARWTRI